MKRAFILLDAHLKILTRFLAAEDPSCMTGLMSLLKLRQETDQARVCFAGRLPAVRTDWTYIRQQIR